MYHPQAIIRLPFDNLTLPQDTLQCVSRFRYSQYPLKTVSTLTVTVTEFYPVHVKMKHPNVVLPLTPPVVELENYPLPHLNGFCKLIVIVKLV